MAQGKHSTVNCPEFVLDLVQAAGPSSQTALTRASLFIKTNLKKGVGLLQPDLQTGQHLEEGSGKLQGEQIGRASRDTMGGRRGAHNIHLHKAESSCDQMLRKPGLPQSTQKGSTSQLLSMMVKTCSPSVFAAICWQHYSDAGVSIAGMPVMSKRKQPTIGPSETPMHSFASVAHLQGATASRMPGISTCSGRWLRHVT
jgi:hypothetical protein